MSGAVTNFSLTYTAPVTVADIQSYVTNFAISPTTKVLGASATAGVPDEKFTATYDKLAGQLTLTP